MTSSNIKKPSVKFCSSCLYSTSSAVSLEFDEKNVCSGCTVSGEKAKINWDERKKYFIDLLDSYRGKFNKQYDCIIPVSGGKDSFFQAHLVKELGYNALLVTYNGNNYSSVADFFDGVKDSATWKSVLKGVDSSGAGATNSSGSAVINTNKSFSDMTSKEKSAYMEAKHGK